MDNAMIGWAKIWQFLNIENEELFQNIEENIPSLDSPQKRKT